MANILSLKSKKREPYATSPLVPAFAASATLANTAGRSDAGQALAGRWCTSCHLVASEQGQASADVPTFQLIANSLGKLDWLEGLSAFSLTRQEIQDLVAYFESLRRDLSLASTTLKVLAGFANIALTP